MANTITNDTELITNDSSALLAAETALCRNVS